MLRGLFCYDRYSEQMKMRLRYSDAVNVLVSSEQLGVPLMNSCVSMGLLPYFVGEVENWQHREPRDRSYLADARGLH